MTDDSEGAIQPPMCKVCGDEIGLLNGKCGGCFGASLGQALVTHLEWRFDDER